MNTDKSEQTFLKLYNEILLKRGAIETEQDARFQVIDRMLIEVLGWSYDDIKTEPYTDSGYIDYLLTENGRNKFVVEAKRKSKIILDTVDLRRASYKVNGSVLKSAEDGLEQAQRYCIEQSVPFAALTTGFEWIAFWSIRTDGIRPKDGKAIVFPSLDAIKDNFAKFYDLFSKEGIGRKLYEIHITNEEGLVIQHSEKLRSVIIDSDIKLIQKKPISSDLEQVFNEFFSSMSGDNDPEMLARCFVESKESKEADRNLRKIADNLINTIMVVKSGRGNELEEKIKTAVELGKGEFALIIGNKGAGKSTFIDRFFRLVLDKDIREKCLVIKVDLADSPGDIYSISSWLENRIINEVEKYLFSGGYPSFNELQGIFYTEYTRWKNGTLKALYNKDKDQFQIKFGEYVEDIIQNKKEKYLRRLLRDSVKSRKLMPCIVFDNTDHFSQPFQEQVFQYAQSVHRAVFSFIICPITDRTIWQLSKSGPFQSYYTKTFYLPVPSTKSVLEKRVQFVKEKINIDDHKKRNNYFLEKGIRLSINDINAFAACVEEIFINTNYIARIIGWLSNYDIRRSLLIANKIILSPIISIEDILKTYITKTTFFIRQEKIKLALICGEYNYYEKNSNEYIINLFSIDNENITTPFLKLSIIQMLIDKDNQANRLEDSYFYISDIQNYFEPLGVSRNCLRSHIEQLLTYRLIEPYDPTEREITDSLRVRVTHSGKIHHEFALGDNIYMSQMALITPVRENSYVDDIKYLINKKFRMTGLDWSGVVSKFISYCVSQDKQFITLPNHDSYTGQRDMRKKIIKRWINESHRKRKNRKDLKGSRQRYNRASV